MEACASGKVQHETKNEAWEVADKMKERHSEIFTVYWCGMCFKWHVAHLLSKSERKYRWRRKMGFVRGR